MRPSIEVRSGLQDDEVSGGGIEHGGMGSGGDRGSDGCVMAASWLCDGKGCIAVGSRASALRGYRCVKQPLACMQSMVHSSLPQPPLVGISRVNGKIVALKEIRLEHEEGAPCTAIREGGEGFWITILETATGGFEACWHGRSLHCVYACSLAAQRPQARQHCDAARHHPHQRLTHHGLRIPGAWTA